MGLVVRPPSGSERERGDPIRIKVNGTGQPVVFTRLRITADAADEFL
jgi:hypothetical protein